MKCTPELLIVLLRISCIISNACPWLLFEGFVQPSMYVGGVCTRHFAVTALLCGRVRDEAALRLIASANVSHISIAHDRGIKDKSLTRADDGVRPWLLCFVSCYLVPCLGAVLLCLHPLVSLKTMTMGGQVCERVQMVPEVSRFVFWAIVTVDNEWLLTL